MIGLYLLYIKYVDHFFSSLKYQNTNYSFETQAIGQDYYKSKYNENFSQFVDFEILRKSGQKNGSQERKN